MIGGLGDGFVLYLCCGSFRLLLLPYTIILVCDTFIFLSNFNPVLWVLTTPQMTNRVCSSRVLPTGMACISLTLLDMDMKLNLPMLSSLCIL